MSPGLDKWLNPEKGPASNEQEEGDDKIKGITKFAEDEVDRLLDPHSVNQINQAELGMRVTDLKENVISDCLDRIKEDNQRLDFLEDIKTSIKDKLDRYGNDFDEEEKKSKAIKSLLRFIDKEIKLEKDMKKQGYGDKDFLRPFG
ncbi:MAG: hypothetical protein GF370_00850 [Candidatus Nealsonbacteria bacterium]|nr:hypothetical protein [Candidatus Nealsonbacteria bacterium]